MSVELPEYYFRIRENGAVVFKVDTENRHRRIEMEQIAVINIRNGDVKPHGDRVLTSQDRDAIETWRSDRRTTLDARALDDIHRTIDHLNLTTQWAQSKAEDQQLEEITDRLLMAMHDLRTVLVRKKADRVSKG